MSTKNTLEFSKNTLLHLACHLFVKMHVPTASEAHSVRRNICYHIRVIDIDLPNGERQADHMEFIFVIFYGFVEGTGDRVGLAIISATNLPRAAVPVGFIAPGVRYLTRGLEGALGVAISVLLSNSFMFV